MAPSQPIRGHARTWWLLIRAAAYAGLLMLLMFVHMRDTDAALRSEQGLAAARALLGEDGPVEWRQAGVLLLAMGVALLGAVRDRRSLDLGLALVLGAAVVRELDDVLAAHVGRNAHRPFMAVLLVGAAVLAVRFRGAVLHELRGFLGRPACWFLFFGAVTLVILAQVLGQTPIWNALSASESAARVAKRYVEEGLELAGYTMVLLGVIEEVAFRRKLPWASRAALLDAEGPPPR